MEYMKRRGECVSDDVGTLESLEVRLERGKKLRNNLFSQKKPTKQRPPKQSTEPPTPGEKMRRLNARNNMGTTQPTIDYQTQNSPFSRYFSTAER